MSSDSSTPPSFDRRYVRYTLWILLAVYILNFLDRQIVNILAEPIKRDLGLSDTQVGLMTGLAFALFYAVLGIPIARYADAPQSNRVGIISVSLALWSGMTVLCGLAGNFVQLLLARIGVGVGEAGCTPASHSLIADTVPPEKRASSIAFFGLGIPLGGLLGMALGGQLADAYGWRTAFLMAGAPGLLMAVLVWFTMKEPRRRFAAVPGAPVAPRASFKEAWTEIRASRAFVPLTIAAGTVAFLGYGKGVWTTIFFIRTHGLTPGEVGLYLGVGYGIAGVLGTWLGGWLADRYGARQPRHYLTGPIVSMVIAAPLLYWAYSVDDWRVALVILFFPTIANSLYYGPAYACAQSLVSPRSRAVAASLIVFAQNLIGLGLGPLFFGMLSDAFRPMAGEDSVRWVLYGAAFLGIIPSIFFWLASRHLNAEMKKG
ncbi:spinster family MFS transporter [Sphingoaurantiacus capsulatus]|uniref:Spinster family MFS transporter n=1 Tax=Sphingoaurantiacus capsulatus TaxID=1771310 RepID=A0ABV7XC92_9SPHN